MPKFNQQIYRYRDAEHIDRHILKVTQSHQLFGTAHSTHQAVSDSRLLDCRLQFDLLANTFSEPKVPLHTK